MDEERYFNNQMPDVDPWDYDSKEYSAMKNRSEKKRDTLTDDHYRQMDNSVNNYDASRYSQSSKFNVNNSTTSNKSNYNNYNQGNRQSKLNTKTDSNFYEENYTNGKGYNSSKNTTFRSYGILSIILGVWSLLTSCFFGLNIVVSIAGIVFGIKGQKYGKDNDDKQMVTQSKIGMVLSVIGMIVSIMEVAVGANAFIQ